MAVELVAVHFPKAGGSSLGESFRAAYGEDGVYLDYADDPADPCSSFSLDPDGCRRKAREAKLPEEVKIIYGHFHVSKYDHLRDVARTTFIRHPVDTIISIYYFWKTQGGGHCLFRHFRENDLSLLELARLPALRYLLSRTYFGGVDMGRFDFIGTTENYSEDCKALSRLLGVPIAESRVNVCSYPGYRDAVESVRADRATVRALRDCLSEDIKFYERVVASSSWRVA